MTQPNEHQLFTVNRADLKKVVDMMAKVVERRSTIPILGYCKVFVSPSHTNISATDLDIELSMSVDTDSKVAAATKFMISLQALRGVCAAMDGEITFTQITHAGGDPVTRITDGTVNVELRDTMPVEDYPSMISDLNNGNSADGFTIMPKIDLHRMIKLSRGYVSKEATRYYLNGVLLCKKPDGNTLRAVATDGHRMAVIDTDAPFIFKSSEYQPDIIVPSKAVNLIFNLTKAADQSHAADLAAKANKLIFALGNARLVTKLIDGQYPDYTRVLPDVSEPATVHLSAAGLRRMAGFAKAVKMAPKRWINIPLAINLKDGLLRIKSESVTESEISMPCQVSENPRDIHELGFNYKYLADQARVTPTFRLRAKSASDPAMIDSDDPNAFWVLMPMRV